MGGLDRRRLLLCGPNPALFLPGRSLGLLLNFRLPPVLLAFGLELLCRGLRYLGAGLACSLLAARCLPGLGLGIFRRAFSGMIASVLGRRLVASWRNGRRLLAFARSGGFLRLDLRLLDLELRLS